MSLRTTWSLVGSALVLFAYIFFVEVPMREARQRPVSRKLFPQLRPEAVVSIQIHPAGQLEVRATKVGPKWALAKPIAYPADGARVESLLEQLSALEWQTCISAQELVGHPQAQEEFGFAIPQFSIAIQQGKETYRLQVGSTSALGDQVYLQVVGGNNLYLVSSELLKLIPRSKNDWRQTAFATLEATDFESIKVRAGGKNMELVREAGSTLWRMRSPVEARANSSKVDEMLAQLQAVQVAGFVSDDPQVDLELFGLHSTQPAELELQFLQKTNPVLTLQVGASPTNQAELVYARRLDLGNVVVIPKEPLRAWASAYTNFLDHHLISTPSDSIESIEVRGEDRFSLQRNDDGQWIISGKQSFAADASLVEEWLASLSEVAVETEKTVVADADVANYGLDHPVLQYRIRAARGAGSPGKLEAQLDFGGTNEHGKVFQRRTDETSVNLLSREQFDRLPRASWQLRNRQIFNFAASNVVSVTIEQLGSRRKLIRDIEGEWTFAPGSIGTINPFSLDEGLHRLGELKAVYWIAQGEGNMARFGFKETDHRVSVEVKEGEGKQTYTIQFGKASPYLHRYAAVMKDGRTLIFEFPAPLYQEFVQRDLIIPPAYRSHSR